MSTIYRDKIGERDGSVLLITYEDITELETDTAVIESPEWADRCIQAVGKFGGGRLAIEGSNNGEDWLTLTDQHGEQIIKDAPFMEQITEVPRFMRPRVISGSGLSINIFIVMRRNSGMRM